ncbi:hypothetical protein AURDEDRAFT_72086 [Auricularia subglabra TFB-10046 SS5]|nr:hypothetical protein AURDEDRAFT_72086 [Auricularia subglabra TFB-10046 SS5]
MYVAYAMWRAKLPEAVLHGALYLLQKRKACKPAPTESIHALFITGYMLASHVLNDDSWKVKDWVRIGSRKFTREEMDRFTRDFCHVVDWDFLITPAALEEFETTVIAAYKQEQQPSAATETPAEESPAEETPAEDGIEDQS